MTALDDLLRREGLVADERLLVMIKVAIWPGDHDCLGECIRRCRDLLVDREVLEEVMLQAVLFCGFPRVINAFRVFNDEWPPARAPGAGLSLRSDEEQRLAGGELFAAICGENTDKVRSMLKDYHAELHEFVMDTAYGRILSRPGLQPRVRELLAIGVLSHTEQIPQLVAHGRGALTFGATEQQIRESIYTGRHDEGRASLLLRKITLLR